MIGYLKLPYANPQERGQKEYHTSLYWLFFFIYWHHYFEYCRNVVLGRKNAKVHHYMLHCSQFIMWSGEADGITIHLEHYKKRKTALNGLIHRYNALVQILFLLCVRVIGHAHFAEAIIQRNHFSKWIKEHDGTNVI